MIDEAEHHILNIQIANDTLMKLRTAARARDTRAERLAAEILSYVINDNLVRAVLDTEETEVPEPPEWWKAQNIKGYRRPY